MSEERNRFDKHRAFLKFKVENINDSFYSDTLNYISKLESTLDRKEREEEAVFNLLSSYGVPKERSKFIGNGIQVLVSRLDKEIQSLKVNNSELKDHVESIMNFITILIEEDLVKDEGILLLDKIVKNIKIGE